MLSLEGTTDWVEEGELDDAKWRDYHPSLEELVANGLPEGPADRIVPDKVLDDFGDWYRGLLKPPPEGMQDTDEPWAKGPLVSAGIPDPAHYRHTTENGRAHRRDLPFS